MLRPKGHATAYFLSVADNSFFTASFVGLFVKSIECVCQDLEQLAAELRADIVHSVSNTGGHLSSSLGVVELAVALHHVFDTPEDKIIWDVGHQVIFPLVYFFFFSNTC